MLRQNFMCYQDTSSAVTNASQSKRTKSSCQLASPFQGTSTFLNLDIALKSRVSFILEFFLAFPNAVTFGIYGNYSFNYLT